MANTENLLAGIFGQDPLKTKEAFDDLMKDRLQVTIDDYKSDYTKNIFTDPTAEDEEPRDKDEESVTEDPKDDTEEEYELTDEDLAALESLTDEELEDLINDTLEDDEAEEDAPLDKEQEENDNG